MPSALAFAVVSFMGVANELKERYEALQVAQLALWDLTRLVLFFMPTIVPYIIFIAYMMGILFAFGRLSQHVEITAMKAAGIPLKRVVLPIIVGGVVLSGVSFVLQDRVQPWSLKRANVLLYRELPERITVDVLPAGVMHRFNDWRIYIGGKDPETRTLKNINVRAPVGDEAWFYYAAEARVVQTPEGSGKPVMPTAHLIRPRAEGKLYRVTLTDWELGLPTPEKVKIPSKRRMLTLRELYAKQGLLAVALRLNEEGLWDERLLDDLVASGGSLAEIGRVPEEIKRDYPGPLTIRGPWLEELRRAPSERLLYELRKMRTEISDRLSLSLACLAVSVVAAPLAVRGGSGGRSFSFAIGFTIMVVWFLAKELAEPSMICPLGVTVLRGLVPDLTLGLAGAWALWRVDRI